MQQSNHARLATSATAMAIARAWKPLLTYELLASMATAIVLGPLLLTGSYWLIGIADEDAWSNFELSQFLRSPRGTVTVWWGASQAVALTLLEFSGLVLLIDAAVNHRPLSVRQALAAIARAGPSLLVLAILATCLAILVVLLLLLLAAGIYGFLLSKSDINYYLAERPPRLWIAAGLGVVAASGLCGTALWLIARWALAVPACVVDQAGWRQGLRSSMQWMSGRVGRFLLLLGACQLARLLALAAAVAALDYANAWASGDLGSRLSTWIWGAAVLIVIDALALQLINAVFAIVTAAIVASEYDRARAVDGNVRARPGTRAIPPAASRSASRWSRAAVAGLLVLVPAANCAYAILWASRVVSHPLVFVTAHRGGPKPAPENSLSALTLAIAAGADVVEIDAQLTADGQVVLVHDRDLRRVTGDSREPGQMTLAQIKELTLNDTNEPREQIPTLDEFLAACGDRIRLNIELKEPSRNPGLAAAVVRTLRSSPSAPQAIVSCFELAPLAEVHSLDRELKVGLIVSAFKGDLVQQPVDFLSMHQRLVTSNLVHRAHERGMGVHAWTVNNIASTLRLLDLGCDNLITSNPKVVREAVDRYSELGDLERILLRVRRWMRE